MAQTDDQSQNDSNGKDTTPNNPDASFEDDPTLLVRTEEVRGSQPGDVRVRIVRTNQRSLRRVRTGLLEATEATLKPRSYLERLKRLLIGRPLPTHHEKE